MLLRLRLISGLLAVIAIAQAFAEEAALSEIEVLVQSPQSASETFVPLANAAPDSEVAKACRVLVSEMGKKNAELPRDPVLDAHSSHSAWYRGKGYAARIHMMNWAGGDKPRLGAYIEFVFAAGDCRYALGGVEWIKAQDDQGRDLVQSLGQGQGRAGRQRHLAMTAVHPDQRRGSANISLGLPDKRLASFAVLKGVSEFLFAARWERITLTDYSQKGKESAFERGCLHVQCLSYETRQKRSGCFFRLDKLPGFRPIPFVTFGDPHFLATLEDAAGHQKEVEFRIWSRANDSWDYFIEEAPTPGTKLHVALLTDVALVRAPFEFRNVPVPPVADPAPARKQP